jgi:hypothetical protein
MVSMENNATVFDVAAGSKTLLQSMHESRQVDTIPDQVVGLDNGHDSSRVMGFQPYDEMGRFPVEMFQYVTEIEIFTFD